MALRPKLTYEPDASHTRKHRGDSPEPKVVDDVDGHPVSKGSTEIDESLAQHLLDTGVAWSPASHRSPLPHSVFDTYRGIPYRAHRRGRTRFYHGFPDVRNRIPRAIRRRLRVLAAQEGAEDEFDRWMEHCEAQVVMHTSDFTAVLRWDPEPTHEAEGRTWGELTIMRDGAPGVSGGGPGGRLPVPSAEGTGSGPRLPGPRLPEGRPFSRAPRGRSRAWRDRWPDHAPIPHRRPSRADGPEFVASTLPLGLSWGRPERREHTS